MTKVKKTSSFIMLVKADEAFRYNRFSSTWLYVQLDFLYKELKGEIGS